MPESVFMFVSSQTDIYSFLWKTKNLGDIPRQPYIPQAVKYTPSSILVRWDWAGKTNTKVVQTYIKIKWYFISIEYIVFQTILYLMPFIQLYIELR